MFYSDNEPLPDDQFKNGNGTMFSRCYKCREYFRQNQIKRQNVGPAYKREIRSNNGEYEVICGSCIQVDCIRKTDHDGPAHDAKYLNRCVLAVARHFRLDVKDADEDIFVRRKLLKWQHLDHNIILSNPE